MDKQAALKYLQSVVKDTSPEMLLEQQKMWEDFSDEKKLLLTLEQIDRNMELLKTRIRNQYPESNVEELQVEVLRILYKDIYSEKEFAQLRQSIKEYRQIQAKQK